MNEKNFDYLKEQMKRMGFGEGLQEDLKQKINQAMPEFALFHQAKYGKDETVATLQFRKSDQSDLYFFNRYSLMVKPAGKENANKQTFYINNNEPAITVKEAYNLINGRAVYKEGLANSKDEKYNAWLQLDFKDTDANGNFKAKQFHQNYGYDLKAALEKYPIKELLLDEDRSRLMASLERGNRQSVMMINNGVERRFFIEAAPQFKSLNFYDNNMKRVHSQHIYDNWDEGKGTKQSNKEGQKQGGAQEDEQVNGRKQKEKRHGPPMN